MAGAILFLASALILWISDAVKDDYFGVQTLLFVLPTNTDDYSATLGTLQQDGSIRLPTETARFDYWTAIGEADPADHPLLGPWVLGFESRLDGVVEVKLHWELKDRVDLALGSVG